MNTLSREHRRVLENTIRKARQIAEAGAKAALEQLAVDHHEPRGNLNPAQRRLRNDLRAHGRQLGYGDKTIDDWLRDGFFEQHCALFQQRPYQFPFVWHIWDGRRDGFHALVNYHRLAAPNGEGRRTLEMLLYTYLGDWIDRKRADQKRGVEGADARVAAAEHLKSELTIILTGEPPYDLFVRWKSLADQPIGWDPDIDDGVRMNIRPFMAAKPLGVRARDACILRMTPRIKWDKDRGKEPERAKDEFPWFWGWNPEDPKLAVNFTGAKIPKPDGVRWNNLHYTRAFKEAARAKAGKG